MNVLFLGGVFRKDKEELILKNSIGAVQFAANTLQWNIIEGLENANNSSLTIVNSIFVGSFPKHFKKIIIKTENWSHAESANDKDIGFVNIFGVKHIWRAIAIAFELKRWSTKRDGKQKTIIIYSMHTPFLFAAWISKHLNSNIHINLICPDLPEYMSPGRLNSRLLNLLKRIDKLVMNKFLKSIDSYVVLTNQMIERIEVGNKPFIVIEGMVNLDDLDVLNELQSKRYYKKKSVLYTGTLNKAYGIIHLLEAFKKVSDNSIELWICGAGDAKEAVERYCKEDSRVKYYGQVDRKKVLDLQRNATLLINPRNNNDEYTKFSFPSKIMEYLHSGTPTLMYNLDGIPAEYESYFYLINNSDTLEDIAVKIETICNTSPHELKIFGEKARNFVRDEKNNIFQSQKIINLINSNA